MNEKIEKNSIDQTRNSDWSWLDDKLIEVFDEFITFASKQDITFYKHSGDCDEMCPHNRVDTRKLINSFVSTKRQDKEPYQKN